MDIDNPDTEVSEQPKPFPAAVIAAISAVVGLIVTAYLGIKYLPGSPYFSNDFAMILGTGFTSAVCTAALSGFAVVAKRDFAELNR